MKKILDKKKIWVVAYTIQQILMVLYGLLYDRIYIFLTARMPAGYKGSIAALQGIGCALMVLMMIYMCYRLLYLYQGSYSRGKWTAINVLLILLAGFWFFDRKVPFVSFLLPVHQLLPYGLLVILILVIWHDYTLLTEADSDTSATIDTLT